MKYYLEVKSSMVDNLMWTISERLRSLLSELKDPETNEKVFSKVKVGFGDRADFSNLKASKPVAKIYVVGGYEYDPSVIGGDWNDPNYMESVIEVVNDGVKCYEQIIHIGDLIHDKFQNDKNWIQLEGVPGRNTIIYQCLVFPPDQQNDILMSIVFRLHHKYPKK